MSPVAQQTHSNIEAAGCTTGDDGSGADSNGDGYEDDDDDDKGKVSCLVVIEGGMGLIGGSFLT